MIERTTVRLPSGLLDRARRKAAAEGRTLTALIEDGLQRVVSAERPAPRRRGTLPVSKASGGLLPRSPSESIDARDTEDADYVERMNRAR